MQSSQLKFVVFCHHNDGVIFTEYHIYIYTSHTDDGDDDGDEDVRYVALVKHGMNFFLTIDWWIC